MRSALYATPDRFPVLVPISQVCGECDGGGIVGFFHGTDRAPYLMGEKRCPTCSGKGIQVATCHNCGGDAVEQLGDEALCLECLPTMAECDGIDRAVRFAMDVMP